MCRAKVSPPVHQGYDAVHTEKLAYDDSMCVANTTQFDSMNSFPNCSTANMHGQYCV